MNITPELLLEHGYKKHRHDEPACDNSLYQKTVRGPEGHKLYFINFYFWEFHKAFPQIPRGISVEVNARMYLQNGDPMVGGGGFDLNLHLEPTATLEHVEGFYAHAYLQLGCGPDWHNQ